MSAPVQIENATASPRRARLGRYALWQLRDYLKERGLPTVTLALVFNLPAALAARSTIRDFAEGHRAVRPSAILRYGSLAAAQRAEALQMSLGAIRGIVGIVVFLGAVLAIQGLVSNDRKNGYFRFLFAKPHTPERYYGQAFLIHWIGFLFLMLLLLLLWGWLIVPIISVHLMLAMALVYLCYAGITFLLTAATKWDWLMMVVMALASITLWTRFGESTSPFAKLLWILPPLTKTDVVYAAATTDSALPWGTLAWLAGYGVACFAAGLIVLRHRRLAIP